VGAAGVDAKPHGSQFPEPLVISLTDDGEVNTFVTLCNIPDILAKKNLQIPYFML
jgi:hypothetical protein